MPQVFKVQTGVGIGPSRIGDTGQVGRALAGAGGQIQQLGGQISAFAQARERAKVALLTKQLEFKYADTFRKQQIEEAMSTDHNNFGQRTTAFSEKTSTAFEQDIAGLKPEQQEILRLQYKSQAAGFQNHMKVREIEEVVKATQAVAGRMVDEAGVAFANARTREEALFIQEKLFAELDVYATHGMLNANQVEIIKRSFVDTAEDARVEKAIQDNPVLAKEMINAGEFELDSKEKQAALNRAEAIQKQRKNEAKVAANQAKSEAKEAKKEAQSGTQNNFLDRLNNSDKPDPTVNEIVNSNLEEFGQGSKNAFLNMLNNKSTKKGPWQVTQDPGFYNTQLEAAYRGEVDPEKPLSWAGDQMNGEDAEHIRKVATAAQKAENKPVLDAQARAIKFGRDSILKGTILSGFDSSSVQNAYDYEHDLRKTLANGEEEGKKMLDMLTPGNKDYIVGDVLKRNFKDPLSRLAEEANVILENDKETPPDSVSKRKSGETIDQYLKRTGQE
jgi:hypothetical protein